MNFAVVSYHLPEPEGTAAGRALLATASGLLAEGHQVQVWSWRPEPPDGELPEWCRWQPLAAGHAWRRHARAIVRPRQELAGVGWDALAGAVAIGDDPVSFAAVAGEPSAVLVLHRLTRLDLAARVRRVRPADLQDVRAERWAAQAATAVLAYSPRVAHAAAAPATFVPLALEAPIEPVKPVDAPVAALIGDFRWPPNRWALRRLSEAWPSVRSRVPSARLLLAGRGLEGWPSRGPEGVDVLGSVGRSVDVLARAAALAFPCPDTSGPKVKVLEAVLHGIPVVTTPAGVEGLVLADGEGAVVTDLADFGAQVAGLLVDPERREKLGQAGRRAGLRSHTPSVAARARVTAITAAVDVGPPGD